MGVTWLTVLVMKTKRKGQKDRKRQQQQYSVFSVALFWKPVENKEQTRKRKRKKKNVFRFYSIMASIEDSGSFDHSSNLCGTKYFFFLFLFVKKDTNTAKTGHSLSHGALLEVRSSTRLRRLAHNVGYIRDGLVLEKRKTSSSQKSIL